MEKPLDKSLKENLLYFSGINEIDVFRLIPANLGNQQTTQAGQQKSEGWKNLKQFYRLPLLLSEVAFLGGQMGAGEI